MSFNFRRLNKECMIKIYDKDVEPEFTTKSGYVKRFVNHIRPIRKTNDRKLTLIIAGIIKYITGI